MRGCPRTPPGGGCIQQGGARGPSRVSREREDGGGVAVVNGWGCARRCHLAVEDAEEGEIVGMLVGSSCRAAVRLTGKGRRQAGEDGVFSSGLRGRGGKHNVKLFEKSCWSYVLISRTGSLRVADGSALRECNEGTRRWLSWP